MHRVAAIMTTPRHEIVIARNYIEQAMRSAGVPLSVVGGVFYGQCMQRALNRLIADGVDLAITVDFDSMFTGSDVSTLLERMVSLKLDALAAIQCRRGSGVLLASGESGSASTNGQPFKVDTAHFGLTVINLNKLAAVEKPWFYASPDKNGDWNGEHTDPDVWFWRQWAKAGNNLYIDPSVKIGHLEEMVTAFNDKMVLEHVYPDQWATEKFKELKGV